MSSGGACFALSMLGAPPLAALMGRQLTILEPTLVHVDVAWEGRAFKFDCLHVEDMDGLLLDGMPLGAAGGGSAALMASWL